MPNTDKPLPGNRKNPVQPRAQATYDAILEAAAQLLERGDKATTNHIAARAGVSIGSVYQYFPNGEAILMAIAEREQARIGAAIRAALAAHEQPELEDAIRTAIHALLSAFGRRPTLRRQVLITLLPTDARALDQAFVGELSRDLLALLNKRWEGRARPMRPVEAFVMSRAILGAVRAAVIEQQPALDDPDFEAGLIRIALSFVAPGSLLAEEPGTGATKGAFPR